MRPSWGWWDEWDDTALQTQDEKFEAWRSEADNAISRSQRLPTILNIYEWAGKKHFVSVKLEFQDGGRGRDRRLSKQAVSTTAPGPRPLSGSGSHSYEQVNTSAWCVYILYLFIYSTRNLIHTEVAIRSLTCIHHFVLLVFFGEYQI